MIGIGKSLGATVVGMGRPIMYGTTKFFLEHFGLQDLSQLPPLREFKELGEAEQALLPIEETTRVMVFMSFD